MKCRFIIVAAGFSLLFNPNTFCLADNVFGQSSVECEKPKTCSTERFKLDVIASVGMQEKETNKSEEKRKQREYKKLKLTKTEKQFLEHIEKQHKGFIKDLVIFWMLAESADVPKTPQAFAETLAKNVVSKSEKDAKHHFSKGLEKLAIRPVYQQVLQFIEGKHPRFKKYRPRGQNYYFFKDLRDALNQKLAS